MLHTSLERDEHEENNDSASKTISADRLMPINERENAKFTSETTTVKRNILFQRIVSRNTNCTKLTTD